LAAEAEIEIQPPPVTVPLPDGPELPLDVPLPEFPAPLGEIGAGETGPGDEAGGGEEAGGASVTGGAGDTVGAGARLELGPPPDTPLLTLPELVLPAPALATEDDAPIPMARVEAPDSAAFGRRDLGSARRLGATPPLCAGLRWCWYRAASIGARASPFGTS
jgi:hypothetical protein